MCGCLAVVLGLFVSVAAAQQASLTAIRCGRLFDGRTLSLQENAVVLIEGKRIRAAGKSVEIPAGAKVIDLSRMTVLPGLIDCHTHMFLHGAPYDETLLKKSLQYRAIWSAVSARNQLLAGFTTIRDLETEGAWYGDVALRDAINEGIVIGPRMQCATRALSVTGSYTPYGYSPDVEIPRGAQIADGVDGVRKAVREQLGNGADVIKIYADHLRRRSDETKAIVEEAAKVRVKVAAHVYHSSAAQTAIQAGVASLEHGMYLDDETFRMMIAKGVYWVPA